MKLHHIALAVTDVNLSADWYHKNLGFTEVHRYDKNNKTFCMIAYGKLQLELISSEDTQNLSQANSSLPRWMRHFCLVVEDLNVTYQQLSNAGATIEKEITEAGFGGHYFFTSDLDGNMIEIWSQN